MKRQMKRTMALAMALALLCGGALAEVRTTGSVWMRTGPGLKYDQVTSIAEGKSLEYLGESSVDERGVTWYKVRSGANTGWVSSKYSQLKGESAAPAATAQPTAEPTAQPAATLPALDAGLLFSTSVAGEGESQNAEDAAKELSVYYMSDLVTAANEIGLISYRQVESEAPYQYYDNSVIVAGNQFVENIVVYGGGYSVFGVTVGMSANAAMACLNAAGLDFVQDGNGMTFEHRAAADSPFYVDENGHDSCVNLWVNEDGVVTEIDWSTYTG